MKIRKFYLLLLIIPLLLIVSQCTKNEANMVGAEFFDRNNMGSEYYKVFYPAPTDTFYQMPIATYKGRALFFGEYGSLKTRTLFRYRDDDLPEKGVVDSVKFTLFFSKMHGDTSDISHLSINKIKADWDTKDIGWDKFHDENLLGDAINYTDLTSDSKKISFKLPNSLLQSWIDTTTAANNFGFTIAYTSPDTGFIVQCHSHDQSERSLQPQMSLYWHVDTTSYSLVLPMTDDVYIANQAQEADDNYLYVRNCDAVRTYLYFDISTIPENASINLATCILKADTLKSWPANKKTFPLIASPLSEQFHLPPDLGINANQFVKGVQTADSALINLSLLVHNWVIGTNENHGFILTGLYEDQDIGRFAYYSSKADTSLMPKLKIYYSLPPSSRF